MSGMAKHRLIGLLCLCLVLLSGCNGATLPIQQEQPKQTNIILTYLQQQKPVSVPSSFIGMNIELTDLCSILHADTAHQKSYEQLYKNFGVGTLHVGGHSIDESIWQPDVTSTCLSSHVVTKTLVQSFFAFARRIHWNVTWGLNFLIKSPKVIADEAAYVSSVGGSSLLGFNIGNEPDLYAKDRERPSKWGYSDYLSEWRADHDAIKARVPNALFFGPETSSQTPWVQKFLHDENASHDLSATSLHYYAYSGGGAKKAHITATDLLSPNSQNQLILEARGWILTAGQYNLPVDITEMNSISNGGVLGVSNSFGSALWASDTLFEIISLGVHQVDFQEVPDAAYALINGKGLPLAIYNGLLLANLALSASVVLPSVLNTSSNLSSYVSRGSDNTLRVTLINKSSRPIDVLFTPGSSYHSMKTLHMLAPSLTSTSGITIGGNAIASNGTLKLSTISHETLSTPQIMLDVPAYSAALFTFSS